MALGGPQKFVANAQNGAWRSKLILKIAKEMCRGRIRCLRQAGSEVSYLSNRSDLRLMRHCKGNAVVTFAGCRSA
jgi:hypothetical protein